MKICTIIAELFTFKRKKKCERLSNSSDLVELMKWANLSEVNSSNKF